VSGEPPNHWRRRLWVASRHHVRVTPLPWLEALITAGLVVFGIAQMIGPLDLRGGGPVGEPEHVGIRESVCRVATPTAHHRSRRVTGCRALGFSQRLC
jgi:hypothetical protein